jgi:DNA-directed RNA polymerase beta' subunit
MMATNNILSPASGRPIAVPAQDMVLGCAYLTKEKTGVPGEGKIFRSRDEVISIHQSSPGQVDLHAHQGKRRARLWWKKGWPRKIYINASKWKQLHHCWARDFQQRGSARTGVCEHGP